MCNADVIARLAQFVPISFSANGRNSVDCAIARTSPELVDRRILRSAGVRQPLVAPVLPPALNSLAQRREWSRPF